MKYRVVKCLVTEGSYPEVKEFIVQHSKFGIFWISAKDPMGDVLSFAHESTAWQFIQDYKTKNSDPRKFKKLKVTGIDYGQHS